MKTLCKTTKKKKTTQNKYKTIEKTKTCFFQQQKQKYSSQAYGFN